MFKNLGVQLYTARDMTRNPDYADLTFKKMAAPGYTEVGQGGVDWDRVMKTAEEAEVKHYVVEQDTNWSPYPISSLKISADFWQNTERKHAKRTVAVGRTLTDCLQ